MKMPSIRTASQVPLAALSIPAFVALALSIPWAITLGTADIAVGDVVEVIRSAITGRTARGVSDGTVNIVWELRLPRVILATVVGAGLAVVGVLMQALVRNPLADPYLLGVSSGASVGAAAVILFNAFGARTLLGAQAISVAGFAGASMAMIIVYLLARSTGGLSSHRMVLGGVAASYVFSAITSLLIFLGTPQAAGSVLFWMLGGLGRAAWGTLAIPVVLCIATFGYALMRSPWLNALALGDELATSVGVPLARFRRELFAACALLTGVLVALSGAIGFVGLILPHVARLLVGADHRRVLTVAAPLGATFVIWCDVLARTVVAPQVLPVGLITAMVGGPAFVVLLLRRSADTSQQGRGGDPSP